MLKKSTFREIRTSLARYLAIFAIVALGVGFFAGLKDCKASMVSTAAGYLDEHNFYDYQIVSSYGIDDESVEIAESWDGVSGAEGSVHADVLASAGGGDVETLRAISLPGTINTLSLVSGRLPENKEECVIDDYHMTGDGYVLGDRVVLSEENDKDTLSEFTVREFEIVGTVNTPVYLDYQRGSTDIGNGSLDTFFYVTGDAFDTDYYTSMYVTLDGMAASFTDEKKDLVDAAEESMDDLAEKVTAARRDTAMREAQEELDEKIEEYKENLDKYNREKADADRKISDAEDKIRKGKKQIRNTDKELTEGISTLNSKIREAEEGLAKIDAGLKEAEKGLKTAEDGLAKAEAGLSEAKEQKAGLEQGHSAGLIDDETYAAGTAQADAAIAQLTKSVREADAGVRQANKVIGNLKAQKKTVKAGLKTAQDKLAEAEKGKKTLKSKEAELKKNETTLAREKRDADSEFAKARKELDDAKDKLDEAQEKIDDMEKGSSYAFPRTENAGYSSFDSNSSIVSNIARIFPVFFFLIAALVCMTTMTRMVDEQRTQIGVLKALGYSNAAIAGKYLFYSGSAAFLGAVTGFFAGCRIFPAVIWNAYTMMYNFSDTVDLVIDPWLAAVSLAAALICSMGATWVSVSRDFRAAPSDLIRPKTPPAGKRILLEYITPLWRRIGFLYKVSIRNIFRDKKRFLMMVIGVSGCTALLIAGMGIRTTIARVADYQFDEISLYDYMTVMSRKMNAGRQADFADYMAESGVSAEDIKFMHQGEVTLIMDDMTTDVTCTAAEPDDFGRFIDLHSGDEPVPFPGEGEAVIVRKLEHDFGLKKGDEITVRDGYREMTVTVSGICDNYVFDSIYVSTDTWKSGMGRAPAVKTALVKMPDGTDETAIRDAATHAANYEYAAAVSVNIDARENVSKMMRSLNAVVLVVILSAALLAFIVLYNLTNINITERIREIATIKVLGFHQLEVTQYVFRENFFLTAIAAVLGIPMGKWLLKFVIDNIVVKMIFFEPRLNNIDIAAAVVMTFVFAAAVNLAMQRRLRNVSMTESLKSVE